LPEIKKLTGSQNSSLRLRGYEQLVRIKDGQVVLELISGFADTDYYVRQFIHQELERMTLTDQEIPLFARYAHPDKKHNSSIRLRAVEAIARVSTELSTETLILSLVDEDYYVYSFVKAELDKRKLSARSVSLIGSKITGVSDTRKLQFLGILENSTLEESTQVFLMQMASSDYYILQKATDVILKRKFRDQDHAIMSSIYDAQKNSNAQKSIRKLYLSLNSIQSSTFLIRVLPSLDYSSTQEVQDELERRSLVEAHLPGLNLALNANNQLTRQSAAMLMKKIPTQACKDLLIQRLKLEKVFRVIEEIQESIREISKTVK
jgi:hypothetical protein